MELTYVKLGDDEVQWALQGLDGWHLLEGQIQKAFKFNTYLDGVAFAGRIAEIAEDLDHHPDILIQWRAVTIRMHTHSVGGISPYDFELAKRIDTVTSH